eukprot:TRINITY_DN77343_c0_g1_i1.p1 TRINITY_DN77343_c0_g1~~TRINITY_DN77343_c0_g1_i1.p1  ORF type:complete len:720 (-),score=39.73 TRINITY_DN77343_c0_g1_i1:40-1986(-)
MVGSYSAYHQVLFSMAIGHWVNAVWEDVATRQRLDQGSPDLAPVVLFGYLFHHTVTICIYAYLLSSGFLGGLQGTVGLLFEAPVLLMNEREIAYATKPVPKWLNHPSSVRQHWKWTYASFVLFRFGPTVLYICTLIPGTQTHTYLHRGMTSTWHPVFYHCSAIFFFLLNPVILCLLVLWHEVDREHIKGCVHTSLENDSHSTSMDLTKSEQQPRAWPGGCGDGSIGCLAALLVALSLGGVLALDRSGDSSDFQETSSWDEIESRMDLRTCLLCFCWAVVWFSGHYMCEMLPIECLFQKSSAAHLSTASSPIKEETLAPQTHANSIEVTIGKCYQETSSGSLTKDSGSKAISSVSQAQTCISSGSAYRDPSLDDTTHAIEQASLKCFVRRTRRLIIYDMVATFAGGFLLVQCRELPVDLLLSFSAVHRTFFTMSVGNWIVAFWEDAICFSMLGHGIPSFEFVTYPGYLLHHIMAMLAFGFCLSTWKLSGLCAIGLFFEAPWVLITWREIQVAKVGAGRWLQHNRCYIHWHYMLSSILFLITRWGATGLYIYALTDPHWFSEVQSLDHLSLTMFHILGIFFTLLNVPMSGMILMVWAIDVSEDNSPKEVEEIESGEGSPSDLCPGVKSVCSASTEPCCDPRVLRDTIISL